MHLNEFENSLAKLALSKAPFNKILSFQIYHVVYICNNVFFVFVLHSYLTNLQGAAGMLKPVTLLTCL